MDTRERIQRYYDQASEDDRLGAGDGLLEFHRSKEIINDYLPKRNLKILDIGGGTGPYSFWLSRAGHEVHLLDASSKHIRIATERNVVEKYPLASIKLGFAGDLSFIDQYFDVVLLMGPLYHLLEQPDRQIALREARRVLRQDGILFAAYISRFASLLDGYRSSLVEDPEFQSIVLDDLETGHHRGSADGTIKYFTDAYLHHPDEIIIEAAAAGMLETELLAIEGFGWVIPNFLELWNDESRRAFLLKAIHRVEKERSLLGISPHIMLVARGGSNLIKSHA